jgi:hypothetical protein
VDGLADLIHAARDGHARRRAKAEALQAMLAACSKRRRDPMQDVEDDFGFVPQPVNLEALNLAPDARRGFRIRFTPPARLYANGNEPLALHRRAGAARGAHVTCDTDSSRRWTS